MRRLNELRVGGVTCGARDLVTAAPLSWSDSLAAAAQLQSREMALLDRMGHRDREDRALAQRLRALGYRFSAAVENVAVGYPSLDDVVAAWLESEGHCDNLMNAAVLEFGLACMDGRSSGAPEDRRYWTLVLGAPAHSR
ncbi:MAG: CAP domain-containing protein [Pseudomonadota bacterium]|nr:CAP domain-containing protein [Pseudomonadota bacterium]